jgi:NAD(P)H-hydrate epimerase
MKTVSASEMRELDRRTIEEFGTHGDVLMERAGQGVAEIVLDVLELRRANTVLLVAGTGNNGGDVFAAASFLAEAQMHVTVWICGSRNRIKGDAEYHLKKMIRRGITPIEVESDADLKLQYAPAVIVDGLLGTGSTGAPRGFMAELIRFMNTEASRSFMLSIDIPSGVDADSGGAEGEAIIADLTATMGLPKTGLIAQQALPYTGSVELIDIGIPAEYIEQTRGCLDAEMIDRSDLFIPRRRRESHKGNYGHVLFIGGSKGFSGAIAMAARAALRAGAGLVSVLTPEEIAPLIAQAAGPEVMVHPVPDIGNLALDFSKDWKKVTSVCAGPGLGRHPELIEKLLSTCELPLTLDADALCVSPEKIAAAQCPVVLTPHPGEFEGLFGNEVIDRHAQARAAVEQIGKTVVLKGAGTIVAHPNQKLAVNLNGNPGMATGGSGDVLAGIISALTAQQMPMFEAAKTGVYLHGLAGDIAADRKGQESLIATDIIDALPDAFRTVQFS